jgi:hypothetical protein
LFFNGEFVQILEEVKKERIFPNWSMAYYDLNNENVKEAERLPFI